MIKKNQNTDCVSIMSNEKAYQISAWKAVSIVIGAITVGVVTTAFAFLNTANADHFVLIATTAKVEAIEDQIIGLDRFEAVIASLQKQLDSIEKNQQYLIQRVDKVIERE